MVVRLLGHAIHRGLAGPQISACWKTLEEPGASRCSRSCTLTLSPPPAVPLFKNKDSNCGMCFNPSARPTSNWPAAILDFATWIDAVCGVAKKLRSKLVGTELVPPQIKFGSPLFNLFMRTICALTVQEINIRTTSKKFETTSENASLQNSMIKFSSWIWAWSKEHGLQWKEKHPFIYTKCTK